jgi:L-asparaginase II
MKPRAAMSNAKPLARTYEPIESPPRAAVVVTRGGIVESQHAIRYAVADSSGAIVGSAGDIDAPTFLRSSAKPLICATVVRSGAADRFGFTDVELAVAAGSHSGEPYHVEAVQSMLAKAGLDESALQCGPHPPMHEPSAAALAAAGERPRSIHNNCSGKHAAILALAVHLGAPTSDYLSASNAAEAAILEACAELFGVDPSAMVVGVDGCGIPVVAVPLRNSAQLYARIADPSALPARWQSPIERVRRAMVNNPAYVAGTGRFDTDLMRATFPNVACKGGAEGFHASASISRKLGMCVKVADGNYRAVSPFVIERLLEYSAIDEDAAKLLETHRRPAVKNHAGAIVGEIRAV